MTNIIALPQGCVLRKAQPSDKWHLQKLVWQFEIEEVLELNIRVISYRLLVILGIAVVLSLQIYLFQSSLYLIKLILITFIIYTFFSFSIAINALVTTLLNIGIGAAKNWSRFWIIEYQQELIGCASVNFYNQNSSLGYLYIKPQWRKQGLGSYLLKYLVSKSNNPVSLVCKPKLVKFYTNYGFAQVSWQELSPTLKIMYDIFRPHPKLIGCPLVLMEYQNVA